MSGHLIVQNRASKNDLPCPLVFSTALAKFAAQRPLSHKQKSQLTCRVGRLQELVDGLLQNRNPVPIAEGAQEAYHDIHRTKTDLTAQLFSSASRTEGFGINCVGVHQNSL